MFIRGDDRHFVLDGKSGNPEVIAGNRSAPHRQIGVQPGVVSAVSLSGRSNAKSPMKSRTLVVVA